MFSISHQNTHASLSLSHSSVFQGLKDDILASVRHRLELTADEAEADEAEEGETAEADGGATELPGRAFSLNLPGRALFHCAEGVFLSDYLMPGEDERDCTDRCQQMLGFSPAPPPPQFAGAVPSVASASPDAGSGALIMLEGKPASAGRGLKGAAGTKVPPAAKPAAAAAAAAATPKVTDKAASLDSSSSETTAPPNNMAAYALVGASVLVAVLGFVLSGGE